MLKRAWLRTRRYLFEHGPEVAVFVVIFAILAVVLLPRMVFTIPAGHVGVLWKRFGGTVLDYTIGEGIAIILPWDRIHIYDLRVQLIDRDFDVLSTDGLKVTVNIAYRFQLIRDKVPLLHKTVGEDYADVLLTAAIGARARDILGRNTPEEIYSYRRAEVQTEILKEMQQSLLQPLVAPASATQVPSGFIEIEDVFFRSIKLPPTVEEAIDRKNQMQQRSLEYDYRLLLEAKESERKRIEARGIKEFQDIVSQGITESYLKWRGIDATQALANSPNSKIVVIGGGKDGLPIILGNTDSPAAVAPAPTGTSPPAAPAAGTNPPVAPGASIIVPSSPAALAPPPPAAANQAGATDLLPRDPLNAR
ncbi:prohibitin family protein [Mycobacterium sp. KBS0706]|uniref:prohibitin family protein n=1 Tax=Mycobacterium sp. KBS0706 TaxID=2578109 RepID=UPI00110FAABE|nr:prohibitin family protein [Mycobacterium sp. KBS0706]TSD83432.1 prohibitin family protein [Mycobacterium sp. KBS0706]